MYARISSFSTFTEVAREHFVKFSDLEQKRRIFLENLEQDNQELTSIEREIGKAGIIVIVFSCMAAEAQIYDYAARHISDSFAREHLDKLDTYSKWLVIPRLVTGKEISKNAKPLQLLKSVIKLRNEIVHSKSQPLPAEPEQVNKFLSKYTTRMAEFPGEVHRASQLLQELPVFLQEIDPNEPASYGLR